MNAPTQMPTDNDPLRFERWRPVLADSVQEVFSMMVGAQVVIPDQEPSLISEVTGMVGLAGELCGVLCVRCSKDAASKIASHMLGIPVTEADQHRSDSVGEICNMVAGNFKAKIDGLQDKCMLSVPTVITGEDYQFHSLAVGKRIEIGFIFEGEPLWIGLELRS